MEIGKELDIISGANAVVKNTDASRAKTLNG